MSDAGVHVLQVGPGDVASALHRADAEPGYGPFEVAVCFADEVWQRLAAAPVDVLVVQGGWDGWTRCASDVAVVVVSDVAKAADRLSWLRQGAQEVVTPAEAACIERL